MTTTIRTTISELTKLVSPVLPIAGDRALYGAALDCLRIRTQGGYITADATDKYVAAVSRRRTVNPDGFDQLVRASDLRTVLRIVKPIPGDDVPTIIRTTPDTVRFECGESRDMAATTLDFNGLGTSTGLDIWKLLRNVLEKGGPTDDPVTIDPERFSVFSGATARSVNEEGLPLIVRTTNGQNRPILVACGDHFLGALMPMRSEAATNNTVLAQWRGLLTNTPAKEKTHA